MIRFPINIRYVADVVISNLEILLYSFYQNMLLHDQNEDDDEILIIRYEQRPTNLWDL